jgi:hypothetical protein
MADQSLLARALRNLGCWFKDGFSILIAKGNRHLVTKILGRNDAYDKFFFGSLPENIDECRVFLDGVGEEPSPEL